jgi:hypothetical protein
VRVKVQIENRGEQADTVPDATALADLVQLGVTSLDAACGTPATMLHLGKLQQRFPIVIETRRRLQVGFDVTIDCAIDDAKGKGHEDYAMIAWVDHQALGSADAHPADDECPRDPAGIEPFLDAIVDKGCGAKNPNGSLGAPILLDVVVN